MFLKDSGRDAPVPRPGSQRRTGGPGRLHVLLRPAWGIHNEVKDLTKRQTRSNPGTQSDGTLGVG